MATDKVPSDLLLGRGYADSFGNRGRTRDRTTVRLFFRLLVACIAAQGGAASRAARRRNAAFRVFYCFEVREFDLFFVLLFLVSHFSFPLFGSLPLASRHEKLSLGY